MHPSDIVDPASLTSTQGNELLRLATEVSFHALRQTPSYQEGMRDRRGAAPLKWHEHAVDMDEYITDVIRHLRTFVRTSPEQAKDARRRIEAWKMKWKPVYRAASGFEPYSDTESEFSS